MSSPDAEDASPSPEHSGDEDENDMVDEKGLHDEGDASPTHGGGGRKSSSNAKDATRPRRKKARRACLACQRAHLTCGTSHRERTVTKFIDHDRNFPIDPND